MVKICRTGLLKLNFEIIPKKHIFLFLAKISAGHRWSWNFFFANFQILGPLGCQGWVVIPQNVKKVKITAPYCAGGRVPVEDLPPPSLDPIFETDFQLPRYIWRMASNLEFVSRTAGIGQWQWLCTFFWLSDRTLIGRVKNFVIWQECGISRNPSGRLLVAAWIWAISWHGGPVQTAGTVRERAAHKSRAAWTFSSLGDCMRGSSHLRGSERELISQTGKKSAVGDSAEPKQ